MILYEIYIFICTLFLAGKDATSFKLKSKVDDSLSLTRVRRWHRDGVILFALYVLPFTIFDPSNSWKYILYSLIIRASIFDVSFNYWAGLNYRYLGSTSWWNKQFIKIFGINGAIEKSIAFLFVLLLLNIIL